MNLVPFDEPAWLALLLLIPFVFLRPRRPAALPFSSIDLLAVPHRRSWRARLAWLPRALRCLWLGILAIVLARPASPADEQLPVDRRLAIILAVDASGSMGTVEPGPEQTGQSRLDVAKALAHRVIDSIRLTVERHNDRAGLVVFSKLPRWISPLTGDGEFLRERLTRLELDSRENLTNVGDALALGLHSLADAAEPRRAILLLTDGAHNVPSGLSPGEAARLAESLGVVIHVVALGRAATSTDQEGFRRDLESLAAIARTTGGRFSSIDENGDSFAALLEDFASADAPTTATAGTDPRPALLLAALALFALEVLLRLTALRITPENDWSFAVCCHDADITRPVRENSPERGGGRYSRPAE